MANRHEVIQHLLLFHPGSLVDVGAAAMAADTKYVFVSPGMERELGCDDELATVNRDKWVDVEVPQPIAEGEVIYDLPEPNLIEEMEPRPVKKDLLIHPLISAENNGGAEDALEGGSNALVIEAGRGKIEVMQELAAASGITGTESRPLF